MSKQHESLLVIATSRSTAGLNSHISQMLKAKDDVSRRSHDAIMNLVISMVMICNILVTAMSASVCTTARVIDDSLMYRVDIMDKPFWYSRCAHDVAHQVTVKFAMAQRDSVASKCVNVLLVKCMVNGLFIGMIIQGNVLLAMPVGQLHIPKNEVDPIKLFCRGLDREDGGYQSSYSFETVETALIFANGGGRAI